MRKNRTLIKNYIICICVIFFSAMLLTCCTQQESQGSLQESREEYVQEFDENEDDMHGMYEESDAEDIGEAKIIEIALDRVEGATIDNITEFEREEEHGKIEYELEIKFQGIEYEFEIDGRNGNIISLEIDD